MGKTELRKRLWEREHGRCWYCDRDTILHCGDSNLRRATNDHIIPLCRGGTNDETNQVSCCRRCNEAKGALTEAEFRSMSSLDAIRFNDAVSLYDGKIEVVHVAMAAGAGYRAGPHKSYPLCEQTLGYQQERKA